MNASGKSIAELLAAVSSGLQNPVGELQDLARILDTHFPSELAVAYKAMLLSLATRIAQASGGLFGVFGSKISKVEKLALTGISMALGVHDADGQLAPAAQTLFARNAGEVPLGNIYPVLKPADWAVASKQDTVQSSVFGGQDVAADEPVVAYAIDSDETVAFVALDMTNGALTAAKLHENAIANLERRLTAESEWVELESDSGIGGVGRVRGLRLAGSYYCAEGLLCPSILKQAHERLNSSLLMAVTPVRSQLYVTALVSQENPEPTRLMFIATGLMQYFNPPEALIGTNVWMISNGRVIGQLLGPAYEMLVESAKKFGDQARQAQHSKLEHRANIVRKGDDSPMLIEVTAHDLGVMLKNLQHVIRSYVETAVADEHFCGETHVLIATVDPAFDPDSQSELDRKLESMFDYLQKQFSSMRIATKNGRLIRLSYSFANGA